MKKFILGTLCVIYLVSIPELAHSQLSGTYSICKDECDFVSFSDAVSNIKQQGFNSDLLFLVEEGQYNSFTISDIVNPNEYSIEFRYDGPDSDSAWVEGKIVVDESNYITLNGFTIFPADNQEEACMLVNDSKWFKMSNCHIFNKYGAEFESNEGLLEIHFPWEGPYYVAEVTNCLLESEDNLVCLIGTKGSARFKDNLIKGNVVRTTRYNYFYDNEIYPAGADYANTGQVFYRNTFHFESIFDLAVQGDLFGNIFFTDVSLASSDVIGNEFHGDVKMSWMYDADFRFNFVDGELRSIFCHGIKIMNNYLYGNCSMNNDNTIFGNNFVFDTVEITHGPGQLVFHNNFGYDSYLEMNFTGGVVQNNNLGHADIWQPGLTDIRNNNYIHAGEGNVNIYGIGAYFYDPHYLSDTNLYATNPALIHKGAEIGFPYFGYDMDSTERKEIPTVGANEICFDWSHDSIILKCADSICLDLCSDSLNGQYWSPADLFFDSTASMPLIFPENPVTVFLHNADGSIHDSVFIGQGEHLPSAYTIAEVDGNTVYFQNLSSCADSYHWEFGDGESSDEFSPVHHYPSDGIYQCRLKASNDYGDAFYTIWFDLVGMHDFRKSDSQIIIYPNPVKSVLYIVSDDEIQMVTILNLHGQQLINEKPDRKGVYELNVEFMDQGFHFLKITYAKSHVIRKFMKQ